MAKDNELTLPGPLMPQLGDLKKNWGWLLALGIISVILGIIGLGMVVALTVTSVIFFGALLLVGGGFQLIHAFKCRGWKSIVAHILIALLYVVAGTVTVLNPIAATTVLTLILAVSFICIGILRAIMAFQHRRMKGWVWPLIGGLAAILIGFMIIAEWPLSALWIIGLFVAIELLINGWSYIFLSLEVKNAL